MQAFRNHIMTEYCEDNKILWNALSDDLELKDEGDIYEQLNRVNYVKETDVDKFLSDVRNAIEWFNNGPTDEKAPDKPIKQESNSIIVKQLNKQVPKQVKAFKKVLSNSKNFSNKAKQFKPNEGMFVSV